MARRGQVQQQASVFCDAVRDLLGTRLAETNIDSDHHLLVTVTDLLPSDTTSIGEIAHRNGVAKRVRVEAAAPSHVATWERLRADLLRLAEVRPRVLQSWPTPTAEYAILRWRSSSKRTPKLRRTPKPC